MSAAASNMSDWLCLGLPGFECPSGLEVGGIALGLALGTWANWCFMVRRLRVLSRHADVPGISGNASGDAGQAKTGNVERRLRFGFGPAGFEL